MRRISAPALIELAIATLKSDVQPAVAPEARYALAMVTRALQTARAEIIEEPEAVEWDLVDHIYDSEGDVKRLAADIRTGKVSDGTHPDLRKRLEALLIAEVSVRNPAVLKRRAAVGVA